LLPLAKNMRYLYSLLLIGLYFSAHAQFVVEEKVLETSTGNLKGTLILPTKGKKFNLVVIQAGSGPTDRNGNSGSAVKANSYRLLAESFAQKNIATLLMDKRGVAASMAGLKKEADLRFDDYATDLANWIKLIKADKRIGKIFIIGHSEGSLVGMIAAQKEKVDGYVSLAGAGESIDKIIVWQYAQQLPKAASVLDSLFVRMKNGQKIDSVPPYLMSIFRPSVQPYIASWVKYNPCEEIKKLTVPVLILQGNTDIQVEVKEAEMLHTCKPDAAYKIIDGMNHILKQAPSDRLKNIATYSEVLLPLMPGLVDELIKFINKKR
jgi:uncharacterized protein